MKIIIETNNDLESYRLLDEDSDQSHDGDNSIEVIADVYEKDNASLIANFLNKKETPEHYVKLEEIIGFFEKDITDSEKRKEEIRKIEFTPVNIVPEQIEMIGCLKEEQVLRYVISTLKKFNNQKKTKNERK